jgi:hypothetical protein
MKRREGVKMTRKLKISILAALLSGGTLLAPALANEDTSNENGSNAEAEADNENTNVSVNENDNNSESTSRSESTSEAEACALLCELELLSD